MLSWPAALRRSLALHRTHTHRLGPKNGSRVVVAMSGGVDSSVTARLLVDKGYNLSAIFMRNWDTRDESGTDSGCEWKKDWADVQRVCRMLDIPCEMVDLSREYWNAVFAPSLAEWEAGGTPNPDIWCNKEVKFGALMKHLATDDTWIATGHYAGKSWSPLPSLVSYILPGDKPAPRPQLVRPKDRTKDQTYYLSSVPEASLARTLFPLAPYLKTEVREMAKRWNLPTATREESMGICFVGEKRRFDSFISQYIPPKPGRIVELGTGRVLGAHDGLWQYTIGQNARIRGMPQRMFVSQKNLDTNEIVVVPGSDHPALYSRGIVSRDWQWIWADSPPPGLDSSQGFKARMQFRHRMADIPCTIYREESSGTLLIVFDEAQKAVASGQVAAVWDGDWCLGCGTIAHALPV